MKNLVIDSRIRKVEYEYLKKHFNVIKLPLSSDVYEEISGHSDIFYCKIGDKIIFAPNALIKNFKCILSKKNMNNMSFIMGQKPVKYSYPNDVLYNVCQIGTKVVGSKYTDKSIKPDILVKQGYVKCSICVTGFNSCITTDKGIKIKLEEHGIEVLYIEENNIKLLKKDKSISNMHGFIGGATLLFDNKFILFGDIKKLSNSKEVITHINRHNLQLVHFKGLDIYDYGGGLIF